MSFHEINFELVPRDRKTMRITLISAMLMKNLAMEMRSMFPVSV